MIVISKNILYSLGRTSVGQLIKAVDAEKEISYTCPDCTQALILRKGTRKRPHFAHKTLSPNCTPETALHYGFKTLLFNKIQKHLNQKLPLEMQWDCQACGEVHKGNLLKKAVKVRLEHNLGTCQPDIALLDEHDCTLAVIEVIVTHAPEQTVLDYYKNNHIAVVSYKLESDEDINQLDALTLKPNSVDICRNPKCSKCDNYMWMKHLLIIDGNCWKCQAPMKVAALRVRDMDFGGDFSQSDIQLASKHEVFIKSHYSKTARRKYVANTCHKCGEFIGDHYLTNYVADPSYSRHELDAGYYCMYCNSE